MSRGVSGFLKGVGAGVATGMIVGAVGSNIMKNNKNVKRSAGRAIKAVGDIIENVQYMMK